jgi:hypothetical protein
MAISFDYDQMIEQKYHPENFESDFEEFESDFEEVEN